jgi:hypothetical protein
LFWGCLGTDPTRPARASGMPSPNCSLKMVEGLVYFDAGRSPRPSCIVSWLLVGAPVPAINMRTRVAYERVWALTNQNQPKSQEWKWEPFFFVDYLQNRPTNHSKGGSAQARLRALYRCNQSFWQPSHDASFSHRLSTNVAHHGCASIIPLINTYILRTAKKWPLSPKALLWAWWSRPGEFLTWIPAQSNRK